MNSEEVIRLFSYVNRTSYTLDDLNEFTRLSNKIKSLNQSELENLFLKMKDYFDKAIKLFEDTDELSFLEQIKYYYSIKDFDNVKESIEERFSIDSYKSDISELGNNQVYNLLFNELKSLFFELINAKNDNDIDKCFKKIQSKINSYKNSRNFTLDILKERSSLEEFLNDIMTKININTKGEKFANFDNDLNQLISLLNSIVIDNANTDIKYNILESLSSDNDDKLKFFYTNSLYRTVRENKEKEITINYQMLYESLFDYVKNLSLFEDLIDYYKKELPNCINRELGYQPSNEVINVKTSKLSDLFDIIEFSNYISFLLGSNVKIDYSKIDYSFILKFYQMYKKINSYQYSLEEMQEILSDYTKNTSKSKK